MSASVKLDCTLPDYLAKKPSEWCSALPFRAAVDDTESEKQVPIFNAAQQRGESLLVASALRLELSSQCEWLIVILHHREEIGI